MRASDLPRRPRARSCSTDRRRRARSLAQLSSRTRSRHAAHAFQHREPARAEPAFRAAARQASPASCRPTTARECARRAADGARSLRARARAGSRKLTSCSAQPRRAAASVKADACGRHSSSSAPTSAASCLPMPKWNGSPEASTTTGRPRAARMRGNAASMGRGQASRSPRMRARGQRQMPLAADDELGVHDEAPCRRRRPSAPSSPMPTMDSHRCSVVLVAPPGMSLTASQRHSCAFSFSAARRKLPRWRGGSATITRFAVTLSLAGRTAAPDAAGRRRRASAASAALKGLAQWIMDNPSSAVVDATHPFAARISVNAVAAARMAGCCRSSRSCGRHGTQQRGRHLDRCPRHGRGRACARARRHGASFSPSAARRSAAFRAAPQHAYLMRAIEQPDADALPPNAELILQRGPFDERGRDRADAHARHRRRRRQELRRAARPTPRSRRRARLKLPVVMIEQPPKPTGITVDRCGCRHRAACRLARSCRRPFRARRVDPGRGALARDEPRRARPDENERAHVGLAVRRHSPSVVTVEARLRRAGRAREHDDGVRAPSTAAAGRTPHPADAGANARPGYRGR